MSGSTDAATTVEVRAVLADSLTVDCFLPGSVVFLRPQEVDVGAVRHNGAAVPVASINDSGGGTPFGVVSRFQQTMPQLLGAFGIATLAVTVAGEAQVLVRDPGPTSAEVSVHSDATNATYKLGRRIGTWLFAGPRISAKSRKASPETAALSSNADPEIGESCALVALHPCLAAGRPFQY